MDYRQRIAHTARRFPEVCCSASRPPGPMLLLREPFRRRLSFSIGLLSVMGAPSDWRFRRISGLVDILLLTLKRQTVATRGRCH